MKGLGLTALVVYVLTSWSAGVLFSWCMSLPLAPRPAGRHRTGTVHSITPTRSTIRSHRRPTLRSRAGAQLRRLVRAADGRIDRVAMWVDSLIIARQARRAARHRPPVALPDAPDHGQRPVLDRYHHEFGSAAYLAATPTRVASPARPARSDDDWRVTTMEQRVLSAHGTPEVVDEWVEAGTREAPMPVEVET